MRVLFMGTPEIAAVCLKRLALEHEIVGVFCQPDKPVGRKAVVTPPPVKLAALERGIEVFQPLKLRDGEAEKTIERLAPELIAVVAYGRILPKEILEIPRWGCVNIHASLLPKYRGAAPIQRALMNGESETGVCSMYMGEGLDTGDIIASKSCPIEDGDDAVSMFEKLGALGAQLLCETVSDIEKGSAAATPQNDEEASLAPPLQKSEGAFSWQDSARDIFNKARALCIWPNACFEYEGKTVKLLKARFSPLEGKAGEVLSLQPLTVAAKGGAVQLLEVKPEGSRLMTGKEWAAGRRLKAGDFI
ncbi:MAG: methionyl-tRNA formyltransferase [Oscillospiraceae bacterium]|nr:methionyl-tRNA formyltransferase [Oscillospiraceae bacterium]